MTGSLAIVFGILCRDARLMLDISQRELASAVGVTRAYIGRIEAGRANPTVALMERIADNLRLVVRLVADLPIVESQRQADAVHAWCSGYIGRRLVRNGWEVRREVLVGLGQRIGWIDLLAFHPGTRVLLIIEIKTQVVDLGAIERQLAWYERTWRTAIAGSGWRPIRTMTWLVALYSDEVDASIRANRVTLRAAFPGRASEMRAVAAGTDGRESAHRGLALIDPSSRRRDWLIATSIDGRRSAAPFRDYADAARRTGPDASARALATVKTQR